MTDVLWRDLFGDESGVVGDMDGSAYKLTLPGSGDVVSVGSTTQASIARVAGFAHRIPQSSPDTITIPAAVGSTRTDIISLRYDPAFTGLPGPVKLNRIIGSSAAIPTYDDSPPGVEDLPLYAITRAVGQALNLATVTRLFPRIAPALDMPSGVALPISSPLGTIALQGGIEYRREIVGVSPAWVAQPYYKRGQVRSTSTSAGGAITVTHGLGTTPIAVLVTPAVVYSGNDFTIRVIARSSTTFQVACYQNDALVPSGVIDFDWVAYA
jgi:hypothetical protein